MDLGLCGRTAIVCGSSRGLGRACAEALAREGAAVVVNGRTPRTVAATSDELRDTWGGTVIGVVADIDTEAGRAALLAACPEPDILITNNAGPPPAPFVGTDADAWRAALDSNLLAPLFLIQAVIEGMQARRFGRIVNITSSNSTAVPTKDCCDGSRDHSAHRRLRTRRPARRDHARRAGHRLHRGRAPH